MPFSARLAVLAGLLLVGRAPFAEELDPKTGLVVAPGFAVVSAHCTVCHSARLIIQNRADREGWRDMIRWMQDTQGLWSLGKNETAVLDYLAGNYGPLSVGRRRPLAAEFLPPL